jgi:hypothetical protein
MAPAHDTQVTNQEEEMSRKARLIGAVLLTVAPLGGLVAGGQWTPAFAQQAAHPAATSKQVRTGDLARAIAAAEQFSGGKVVEIRYRNRGGIPGFDAVAAKGGTFSHLRIDIPNNAVTAISQSEIPWRATWELKADARSLTKAKVSLAQAVTTAEKLSGSPAVDAGVAAPLQVGSDIKGYNVEVMQDGAPQRVVIDASSGERIANPGPFLEPWDPEKNL